MLVEQIWTANEGRNFNYLIACPETGEAMAVDPYAAEMCLARAKEKGWTITQIMNTHHHRDHTGGNAQMVAATKAKIIAHEKAKDQIPEMNIGIKAGDTVKVGKTVTLTALDTPGHTMSHICLLSRTDQPALFSGDTLFNAGAGNCKGGGHPDALYETFAGQLAKLSDATLVYPGHDYIVNNLNFTIDREPDNERAKELKALVQGQDTNKALVTTLGVEKQINTFFRLHNPTVVAKLREKFPDLPEKPNEHDVFVRLRELRNSW